MNYLFLAILMVIFLQPTSARSEDLFRDSGRSILERGDTLEVYNPSDGSINELDVESVNTRGSRTEYELYNPETEEYFMIIDRD